MLHRRSNNPKESETNNPIPRTPQASTPLRRTYRMKGATTARNSNIASSISTFRAANVFVSVHGDASRHEYFRNIRSQAAKSKVESSDGCHRGIALKFLQVFQNFDERKGGCWIGGISNITTAALYSGLYTVQYCRSSVNTTVEEILCL